MLSFSFSLLLAMLIRHYFIPLSIFSSPLLAAFAGWLFSAFILHIAFGFHFQPYFRYFFDFAAIDCQPLRCRWHFHIYADFISPPPVFITPAFHCRWYFFFADISPSLSLLLMTRFSFDIASCHEAPAIVSLKLTFSAVARHCCWSYAFAIDAIRCWAASLSFSCHFRRLFAIELFSLASAFVWYIAIDILADIDFFLIISFRYFRCFHFDATPLSIFDTPLITLRLFTPAPDIAITSFHDIFAIDIFAFFLSPFSLFQIDYCRHSCH